MSDLAYAISSLTDAWFDHDEAESYYEGTADEVFASVKLQRALGTTSKYFRVNYARVPVRSRLSRLEINALTGADQRQTDTIQEIWDNNLLGMEAHDIHEAALKYGEAYAIVWPGEDDSIEVFYNSPKTVRLFYSAENPRKKIFAIKMWSEGELTRVDMYYADRIEQYISRIQANGQGVDERDFEPYIEEEGAEWPLVNPFGEVPVFHFRTQRMYGRPEHKDAYGPQAAITKLVTTQMSTVDFSGFPQRYALEDPTMSAAEDEAGDWDDADETASDGTPALKSGAGELWWLKGIKQVGQFQVADPDAFLEPMREYVQTMAVLTDTPLHAFRAGGQMPSGEARRAAEVPLIKRVKDLQLAFGATWRELFRFALRMSGIADPAVAIHWAEPESYDDTDVWKAAKLQVEVGVPVRQVLLERGYTQDQVDDFLGVIEVPSIE